MRGRRRTVRLQAHGGGLKKVDMKTNTAGRDASIIHMERHRNKCYTFGTG